MQQTELATFGGGCFWCTEAIFSNIKGVEKVIPGYSGGIDDHPTYLEVSSGSTGHAEAIQITFKPREIKYEDLLYIFWKIHDPTTLNRQGSDVGTQYRSVIFFHTEEQKNIALKSKENLEKSAFYKNNIVTEILPFTNFFPAEPYHKEYYFKNRNQPYCRLVIDPKIQKLRKELKKFIK